MPQKKIDYAGLNQELDELMERLESGELDVDAAVKAYERGLAIVSLLEEHLKNTENRVRQLAGPAADDEEE